VLQAQWQLNELRVATAKLKKVKDGGVSAASSVLWAALDKALTILRQTMSGTGLKDAFDKFVGQVGGMLKPVPWDPFVQMTNKANDDSTTTMKEAMATWAVCVLTAVVSLENEVPLYKPYVEDTFDVEKVKVEIIGKKWDGTVRAWSGLNTMFECVKSAGSGELSFEMSYSATAERADETIKTAKDFIAVVASCDCIINVLPNTPKADRQDTIKSHQDSVKQTGALLPPNLALYFDQEYNKCSKRK
jgi:hypothetical protein